LALAQVAKALAATDPARATQLTADAERIAQSITESGKELAPAEVAKALAATDPRPRGTHRPVHHQRELEGIGIW